MGLISNIAAKVCEVSGVKSMEVGLEVTSILTDFLGNEKNLSAIRAETSANLDISVDRQARVAEVTLLSAALHIPSMVHEVVAALPVEAYIVPEVNICFKHIAKMVRDGNPVNVSTLSERMSTGKGSVKDLDMVGGVTFLESLKVPGTDSVDPSIAMVRQVYTLRKGGDLFMKAYMDTHTVDVQEASTMLTSVASEVESLVTGMDASVSTGHISDTLFSVLENLDRAATLFRKGEIAGKKSCLYELDMLTGGWQDDELIVMAGRPGMGKTAFILDEALTAARNGEPVLFWSLEMSRAQLIARLISKLSGVDSTKMRKGSVSDLDFTKINSAVEDLDSLPIYIEDTPGVHVNQIVALSTSYWRKHGIKRIYVDYIQLCRGEGNIREQEISYISRTLKGLAKRLKLPVFALSQLSRAVETRGGSKRPMLSDLRESGAIEQDADMVAFFYRPEYYDILEDEAGNSLKGLGEIIIAKYRNGMTDTVTAAFDGPTMSWKDRDSSAQTLKGLVFKAPGKPDLIPMPGGIDDEIPF